METLNVGRYISSDPIGIAGGLNTFGYVRQSPTQWIDPWGLDTQYSVNFGGTLAVFLAGGNAGISVGLSFPDNSRNLSDAQLYISPQAGGMFGLGVYAGFGIGFGTSSTDGPLPVGFSGQTGWFGEADAGFGPSVGANIQAPDANVCTKEDPQGKGPSFSNPAYSWSVPVPKGGEGIGAWAGAGRAATGTGALPRFGAIYDYFFR